MEIEIRSKKIDEQDKDLIISMTRFALTFFPELHLDRLRIRILDTSYNNRGVAYRGVDCIGLTRGSSLHTIAHELMHLVQHTQEYDIPYSEFACDVWTVARADVFNADCCYVDGSRELFLENPKLHRQLMIKATKYYKILGKRKWANRLKKELKESRNSTSSEGS